MPGSPHSFRSTAARHLHGHASITARACTISTASYGSSIPEELPVRDHRFGARRKRRNWRQRLPANVEIVPRQPQAKLPEWYNRGDVFLFPTLEDGFAVVLAQAYANALPIIATTNCAGPDMIRHGESGWVLPIRRPDLFIEQLLWCDAHRDNLADVVQRLYDCWYQARDWNDVAADFERIVSECRRGSPPGSIATRQLPREPAARPLKAMDKSQFTPLLATWIAVLVPLVIIGWRSRSVGLVAALCFQMWMFYWLGRRCTRFRGQSWMKMTRSFWDSSRRLTRWRPSPRGRFFWVRPLGRAILAKIRLGPPGATDPSVAAPLHHLWPVAYFVLAPTIGRFPGMNAIPAVASQLVVIGCCIQCWFAWHLKGRSALLRSLVPPC